MRLLIRKIANFFEEIGFNDYLSVNEGIINYSFCSYPAEIFDLFKSSRFK